MLLRYPSIRNPFPHIAQIFLTFPTSNFLLQYIDLRRQDSEQYLCNSLYGVNSAPQTGQILLVQRSPPFFIVFFLSFATSFHVSMIRAKGFVVSVLFIKRNGEVECVSQCAIVQRFRVTQGRRKRQHSVMCRRQWIGLCRKVDFHAGFRRR